jgi:hypothetical protein
LICCTKVSGREGERERERGERERGERERRGRGRRKDTEHRVEKGPHATWEGGLSCKLQNERWLFLDFFSLIGWKFLAVLHLAFYICKTIIKKRAKKENEKNAKDHTINLQSLLRALRQSTRGPCVRKSKKKIKNKGSE